MRSNRREPVRLVLAVAVTALLAASAGCTRGQGTTNDARHGHAVTAGARQRPPRLAGDHLAPREKVPVLMYHVIESAPPGAALPALYVSRTDFAAQVEALAARGYHGVTLQQVWDAWHRHGRLPSKPVVLSFDDGYRSQYTNALPILRAKGWPGVLNLEVAVLHVDLRPPQVRKLIAAGWEVDAHTMTHPDLTKVDDAKLRYEVAGSRARIRRQFHVPVNFFCYPAGRYDAHVSEAVRLAGFLAATTTAAGLAAPAAPAFELHRVRVNAGDGAVGLERKLRLLSGNSQLHGHN